MYQTKNLGWLHPEIQSAILNTSVIGQGKDRFKIKSVDGVQQVERLAVPSHDVVFAITASHPGGLQFGFDNGYAGGCFSGDLIENSSLGLAFSPTKIWTKVNTNDKKIILGTLLFHGTDLIQDVSVMSDTSVKDMFASGALLQVAGNPLAARISGILIQHVFDGCGLNPESKSHPAPLPALSSHYVSKTMLMRDFEYVTGLIMGIPQVPAKNSACLEHVVHHSIFWTSLAVYESSNPKFSSITPQDQASRTLVNTEVAASRHAVKLLADTGPVLMEIRKIIGAHRRTRGEGKCMDATFYKGKLVNTSHNVDYLCGVRYDEMDVLRDKFPYPARKVGVYTATALEMNGVNYEDTISPHTLASLADWQELGTVRCFLSYVYRKAFAGVDNEEATALLVSCQSILNYLTLIAPKDTRRNSAWVTFRQQYLIIHAVRKTLALMADHEFMTHKGKRKIAEIISSSSFETSVKMRNDLTHYDLDGWLPDLTQDDFGMSMHYHGMSYDDLRVIIMREIEALSGAMNQWGFTEKHAGIPCLSSMFSGNIRKQYNEA